MNFRNIYIAPLFLLAAATIYIMLFNTTKYLEVIFIFYTSTILMRNNLLKFFDKNRFVLFIVAEFFLLVLTGTTCVAVLLLEDGKSPVMFIANIVVLLAEMGYSLKEYPHKFKINSTN